ncbi:ubiquitin-protein transferase activating protein [Mortierella sp. 14UC]|nr:ubiquitin-protein transferase activating protein [Mortierella sp. 14UC]
MIKVAFKRPSPDAADDGDSNPDTAQPIKKHAIDDRVQGTPKKSKIGSDTQETPPLESHLYKVRMHRLEESRQRIYIPPMAKGKARDDALFPLMDKVQEFLASECEVMLILGDSGAGKSTFIQHLEHQLWTSYNMSNPIPLYINLPAIDRPDLDMITKQLRILDFKEEQILELKQRRRFVLICDGYDEYQLTTNLHRSNLLNRSGQWKAKIIITCRSQYLCLDYLDRFVPRMSDHQSHPRFDLFLEALIMPFSRGQIEAYVTLYAPLEPRPWVAKDYMQQLTAIPNLMDLVRNPFILCIALEALPGATEGNKDLTAVGITRAQLYDRFVDHWLDTNKRRLEGSNLSDEDREMLDHLRDADFIHMGIDYCTRLAYAIFDKHNGNPSVHYVHLTNKDPWKVDFFGPNHQVRMLRGACLLTRIGNHFSFIHRSILEYFFSRSIHSPIRVDDDFGHTAGNKPPIALWLDPSNPLFQRNLLAEPSIIQFLCDRVKSNLDFEQQLRAVIDLSKTDVSAAIAATNAITILVRADIPFHDADLRGVRIPGADLSNGQFDSAQFQGADLRRVDFSRSWMREADMSGTLQEGVRFGELEYLDMERRVVLACTYSPDGRLLAVGLYTGQLEIYNTNTWTRIHHINGHTTKVRGLGFSPDSQRIVSGGDEKTVRVWDCTSRNSTSGKELLTMDGHTSSLNSVMYSPSGKRIASASKDKTVRLWDSQTGECVFVFRGHTERVMSVRFSPDGQQLVSGDMHGTIRFWNPEVGQPGAVCKLLLGEIWSLAYSPDGRWLASGHDSGAFQLWNAFSSDLGPTLSGHAGHVNGIAFSPDGRWVASSSGDKTVRLWDASTGSLMFTWNDHSAGVYDLAFSPDGLQIASGGFDLTVRLRDVNPNWSRFVAHGQVNRIHKLTYPPKNRTFLSVTDRSVSDRTVRHWESVAGAPESVSSKFPGALAIESIVYSEDGSHIAIGGNGRPLEDRVIDLAYSRCGRWGVSLIMNTVVQLRDLRAIKNHILFLVKKEPGQTIGSAAFSPTGNQLAIGSWNGDVRLFDPETMATLTTGTSIQEQVLVLAYSPDGQQLALGAETAIYLWDLASDTPSISLRGGPICSLAYSPCGRWLASGIEDNTVRVWYQQRDEVESWSCVSTIRGFFGNVRDIMWNPVVPMEFATGCKDGSVRVWQVSRRSRTAEGENEDYCVKLLWGPNLGILCAEGLVCKDATGLNLSYRRLLIQRGAVKSTVSLKDDGEQRMVEV